MLLIRKAQDMAGERRYQEALTILKEVEGEGPGHPPHFYSVKADIYCQLQTPELAIPLYKKLMAQEAKELLWWRINSHHRLIEIYEKQKKYDECINLTKELIALEPEDEYHVSNLARYYCLTKEPEKGEQPLNDFLRNHSS